MKWEKPQIPVIEELLYYLVVLGTLGMAWVLKAIIRRAIVEAMAPVNKYAKSVNAGTKKKTA